MESGKIGILPSNFLPDCRENQERPRIPGARRRPQPGPARVPAGRQRGDGKPLALHRPQPALRRARPARSAGGARAHDPVPRELDRRQGRGAGQPRLPHPAQLRHRPLQGRPALPPLGERVDPEVPGFRADLQERADHPAHGRRQGRQRLRPQGQELGRGHALLPGLRERAVPPRRRRHRRARGRHRRGRPRGGLHDRHDEEADQPGRLRLHRQGPVLRRLADPARGHRLRHGVLRRGNAQARGPRLRGPARQRLRLRQRGAIRGGEGHGAGRQGDHRVRLQRHRGGRGRLHAGQAGRTDGGEEPPVRARGRVRRARD